MRHAISTALPGALPRPVRIRLLLSQLASRARQHFSTRKEARLAYLEERLSFWAFRCRAKRRGEARSRAEHMMPRASAARRRVAAGSGAQSLSRGDYHDAVRALALHRRVSFRCSFLLHAFAIYARGR